MILSCVRAVRRVAGQYNDPGNAANEAGFAVMEQKIGTPEPWCRSSGACHSSVPSSIDRLIACDQRADDRQ